MIVDIVFYVLYVSMAVFMIAMGIFMLVVICRKKKSSTCEKPTDAVSVIMVARNNIVELRNIIPALIAQDHPRYEVIVVDDRSSDGTAHFLSTVQKNYSSLIKTVYVREDTPYPWPGRKFSISMGVKAASYERIVIVDVNDRPSSNVWLSSLMKGGENKNYIIGLCKTRMINGVGAWWDMLVGYSGRLWAITCAVIGRPFAAQSSNFSFLKSDFLSGGAYMNNMRVPSGEASFLLQDKREASVCVVMDSESMMERAENASMKELWKKSVRRVAMWRISSSWYRMAVIINPAVRLVFMMVALWGVTMMYDKWYVWLMLLMPMMIMSVIYYFTSRLLHINPLVAISPVTDVILLPVYILMRIVAFIKIPTRWK